MVEVLSPLRISPFALLPVRSVSALSQPRGGQTSEPNRKQFQAGCSAGDGIVHRVVLTGAVFRRRDWIDQLEWIIGRGQLHRDAAINHSVDSDLVRL